MFSRMRALRARPRAMQAHMDAMRLWFVRPMGPTPPAQLVLSARPADSRPAVAKPNAHRVQQANTLRTPAIQKEAVASTATQENTELVDRQVARAVVTARLGGIPLPTITLVRARMTARTVTQENTELVETPPARAVVTVL